MRLFTTVSSALCFASIAVGHSQTQREGGRKREREERERMKQHLGASHQGSRGVSRERQNVSVRGVCKNSTLEVKV